MGSSHTQVTSMDDGDSWGRNKSRDDDDYRGGGGYNSPRSRPGDWNCGECQFSNFASRNSCYKCNASKEDGGMSRGGGGGGRYGGGGGSGGGGYRRRDSSRSPPRGGGGGGSRRPGDWFCSQCQFSNFASRERCFKCAASKDSSF